MKWSPGECLRGDMIRVRLGSIYHYGVFVSEDEVIAFGLPPIERFKDNPRRLVVCATDIDVFSCGEIVERAVPEDRAEKRKMNPPDRAVSLAKSRIGETGYDLLYNNCEHFATECVFGERRCTEEEDARKRWLSRPICDVYVASFAPDEPDGGRVAAIYPPERRREIEATANAALRAARVADWELLAFAAKRSLKTDVADALFKKKLSGRWICDRFDFSLTHTKSAVAVAVSNFAVGVDMEFPDEIAEKTPPERLEAIKRRFFTQSEQNCGEDAANFAKVFTKKEAVFKRSGKLSFLPSKIDTSKEPCASFRLVNGAVISVCSEHLDRVRIYTVECGNASLAVLSDE